MLIFSLCVDTNLLVENQVNGSLIICCFYFSFIRSWNSWRNFQLLMMKNIIFLRNIHITNWVTWWASFTSNRIDRKGYSPWPRAGGIPFLSIWFKIELFDELSIFHKQPYRWERVFPLVRAGGIPFLTIWLTNWVIWWAEHPSQTD